MASVYHFELRKFPKAVTRFNQTGQQIGAIAIPWVQERIVEVEDFKWSPHDATLTILEGPPIAIERISMGRGWRTVQREGRDVTERVFAEARQALADGTVSSPALGMRSAHSAAPAAAVGQAAAREGGEAASERADELALGVELGALLGPEASQLLAAWRGVAARASGLSPSESLALAERELRGDRTRPAS